MSDEQLSSTNENSADPTASLLTDAVSSADSDNQDHTAVDTTADDQQTDKPEVEGAPEAYEFNLPEGVDGGQVMEEFKVLAKEYNLPQDKAQGLVDLWQKAQAQTLEQWATVKTAWVNEVKNDKEIGGKNFDETMQTCGRFLRDLQLGPDFMQYMDTYGLGSHPAFVKGIYKMALKTMEDKPVMTNAGPGTQDMETRIKGLYGQSNMT